MKILGENMNKFRLIIVIMLVLFTALSCNSNNAPSVGGIRISISNGISRGIEPSISLDVTSYALTLAGPNGQQYGDYISAANSSYTKTDLLPGEWRVKAVARNSSDQEIGICETTVTVLPGETTAVTMNVTEFEGNGTFTVSLTAPSSLYIANIYSVVWNELVGYPGSGGQMILQEDGTYKSSFTLPNGYYLFKITCNDNSITLPDPVAFRIVKGDSISASLTAESKNGSLSVTIDDKISATPILTIDLTETDVAKEESVTASVSASEGSYIYQWFVDGRPRSDSPSENITVSFTESGVHEISCLGANFDKGIVITSKTYVTVNE